ncbi:MAG: ssk1 response regulator receiver [Geoglossum umbratile]|nr:MAG: ssk1 response regulator receiver [Geoglossum umbratile]
MVDLKGRLSSARARLLRRSSSGIPSTGGDDLASQPKQSRPSSRQKLRVLEPEEQDQPQQPHEPQQRGIDNEGSGTPVAEASAGTENLNHSGSHTVSCANIIKNNNTAATTIDLADPISSPAAQQQQQQQPPDTPLADVVPLEFGARNFADGPPHWQPAEHDDGATPTLPVVQLPQYLQLQSSRPNKEFFRRQSLVPSTQTRLIRTLLESELPPLSQGSPQEYTEHLPLELSTSMVNRKIWVKRPSASATLVSIHEDDLVDDAREVILKKYANSLGRSFDAPDITLRITPRDHSQRHYREVEKERILAPDESIARALDTYFPGGQSVEDALIVEVPSRRTPKPSPRSGYHMHNYPEENRLVEGGDYFPPMPVATPSPHLPTGSVSNAGHGGSSQHPTVHSMSVLTTGQVPSLPSPGRGSRHHRPRMGRTHTSSPTIMTSASGTPNNGTAMQTRSSRSSINSNVSDKQTPPAATPLPNTSAPETPHKLTSSTPPRVASPRPTPSKKNKNKTDHPQLPVGLLDGAVPPINVLIVEDNIINLKLLEAFMKRLKVRWQTAMNGKEAVSKWRTGGFHLVLMDIQLPVMNGLEATKEIRRLERLNSIGVFWSSASPSAPETNSEADPTGADKLTNTYLFKSPIIIVALTASSLQSDRHEALAAGCNDFLTKPVNFVWLERKVMEWGCMQALIDFDGWRKWKDFSQNPAKDEGTKGSGPASGKGGGKSGGRKDKPRNSITIPQGTDNLDASKAITATG